MPQSVSSMTLYAGMTACMTESRHPRQGEVEAVAAKIWGEAFAQTLQLPWENLEVDSACHRRMIAAARVALDPPDAPVWNRDEMAL